MITWKKVGVTALAGSMDALSAQADDVVNTEHAARFESLVVQDNGGRLKPANTLCSEFLRKIYGKDKFNDLSATQVILGMMNDPVAWSKDSIVKVYHPTLRKLLGSNDLSSKYIRKSFNSIIIFLIIAYLRLSK